MLDEEILRNIQTLRAPIFTEMLLPKKVYDLLASQVGRADDSNPAGIRFTVNNWLPVHIVACKDADGDVWIINLQEGPDAQPKKIGKAQEARVSFFDVEGIKDEPLFRAGKPDWFWSGPREEDRNASRAVRREDRVGEDQG